MAGVGAAIRSADLGLLALGLASVVALAFILRSSGTWVQLKAFCMIAPIALAFAFAGAAALARRERLLRIAGLGAAIAVAGGVLFGNALQYHTTTLGDYDRMIDLKRINARYAGQGPTLFPNFDEFGEYFLRDVRASGLVNPWRSLLAYNRTAVKTDVQVRDTDEYDHGFLQDFRLIIRRRDPTASRPPGNYRLVETTREYAIWKQVSEPRQIAAHHPLDGRRATRSERFCRRVRDSVARAGAGAQIRYAVPPADVVSVAAPVAATPAQWGRVANTTTLLAGAPGRLNLRVRIPRTGAYRVSMIASVGRTVTVSIDGRRVGALRWRESYPGQYNPLSTVRLTRGIHRVQVVRKGGDLLPGTGNDASGRTTLVGPLAFEPTTRRDVVRTVPASELASLCASAQRLDWIEVLRPARA